MDPKNVHLPLITLPRLFLSWVQEERGLFLLLSWWKDNCALTKLGDHNRRQVRIHFFFLMVSASQKGFFKKVILWMHLYVYRKQLYSLELTLVLFWFEKILKIVIFLCAFFFFLKKGHPWVILQRTEFSTRKYGLI